MYLFIYTSGVFKLLLNTCRLDSQRGFEIKKTRMLNSWRNTRKFRKVK